MKIVAFVPAKGNSERVPSKNTRILDGDFLFRRKLKQLLACEQIDEVWLDTDSAEIIDLANDLPIKILQRDPALATNATDGHELFANECRAVPEADVIIQALCTAPFIDSNVIGLAIERLLSNPEYDSLVAVRRESQYTWRDGEPTYGRGRIPNSVDLESTIIESMSLYILRRCEDKAPQRRFGRNPLLFDISERDGIDVNNEADLQFAKDICQARRIREYNYFRILKHHLSSSILSDVSKDMGHHFIVDPSISSVSRGKILGRTKTLKLGGLQDTERDIGASDAWKGIYKALQSYNFVETGDVIMVENAISDRAYFGDLNCHLALRAGAVGVVVDGYTRDVESVRAMGMPVYARGAWSNDIKYEGTTISYNAPIVIGGIPCRNDDVVFADSEGLLIIPAEHWGELLAKALNALFNEVNIRKSIIDGQDFREIINNYGFF